MSHFSVAVILPAKTRNAKSAIAALMKPYSENLEVPAYDRPCHCIGWQAAKHGKQMADKLVGTWDERRKLFHAQDSIRSLSDAKKGALGSKTWELYEAIEDQIDAAWQTYRAPFEQAWNETRHDYTVNHPAYGQPDANCSSCEGTGVYRTTYNPQSKWDWYRVGGRFDGVLTLNEQSSEGGFNFDAKHETLANNSIQGQALVDHHARTGEIVGVYAVVTPDGEWHERGEMGWWGIASNEKPQSVWEDWLLDTYTHYAQYDFVLLDCHI